MPIFTPVLEHKCPSDGEHKLPDKWRLLTWNGGSWYLKPPEAGEVSWSQTLPTFPGWDSLVEFRYCPFCGEKLEV